MEFNQPAIQHGPAVNTCLARREWEVEGEVSVTLQRHAISHFYDNAQFTGVGEVCVFLHKSFVAV